MIVGEMVFATVGPAFAAAPPWEPDPNALGAVVFYDAAGNVLTGGSNLRHIADYAATTSGPSVGATKATLIFAAPDHTKPTSLWATGSGSASTTFPNNSAPPPIQGPGFTKPLVTLGPTDGNLTAFLGAVVKDTTQGYANVYQVRIKDSGPYGAGSGTKYWETNIAVNEAAGTWTVLWPEPMIATATSITTSPPDGSSAGVGTNVSLSATVTPASEGSVQFFDGTTAVGSPHPVTTSNATVNEIHTNPVIGTHTYTAVFTPASDAPVLGSTSSTSTVTICALVIGDVALLCAMDTPDPVPTQPAV